MPIRLYGIAPISVTSDDSRLKPQIAVKDEVRPEQNFSLTVSEASGRRMAYTLAVVDEGLLDLTRFKTPDAWNAFNAREALGVRTWDLYGHVAGAFGGIVEQMFSIGGDEALLNGPKAIVNRFTPMVYFDGPFIVEKGKKRTHEVYVPNYNGRVRVMVVASDGDAFGSAEHSVVVRKPLMLIGTMPRVIGAGDEATVSATVFATQQGVGNVNVSIASNGDVEVLGDRAKTVVMNSQGDQTVQFRIKAGQTGTSATISLSASGAGDKASYVAELPIRTVSQLIARTSETTVEPGKTWQPSVGKASSVVAEVTGLKPLNIATRLRSLLGYPHGCVEQTTSKAFPQIYLQSFTELTPQQTRDVEDDVKSVISRLSGFQTTDGGMAYWPGRSYPSLWSSAYVYLFLTEAEAKGFFVPSDMKSRLASYLKRTVRAWKTGDSTSASDVALALYSLSNGRQAELGTMNRMKEAKDINAVASTWLSAAYALAGHADVSKQVGAVEHKGVQPDYARLLSLTLMDDASAASVAEVVRQKLVSDSWLSTYDASMSLVAISKYYERHNAAKDVKFNVSIDGKTVADVKTDKMAWNGEFETTATSPKVVLSNKGDGSVNVRLTAYTRAEQEPVQAVANGLALGVTYVDADGAVTNASSTVQGQTFRAVVSLKNTSGRSLVNVAVTHVLPSGWEVLKALPNDKVAFQDLRDDRVMTYVDALAPGQQLSFEIELSATYAGTYYLPAITAEAMYDSSIFGCTSSGEAVVER